MKRRQLLSQLSSLAGLGILGSLPFSQQAQAQNWRKLGDPKEGSANTWRKLKVCHTSGRIRSWGLGSLGQLGNNTTATTSSPVFVCGISTAIAVASSGDHALALLSDGTVRAWGSNTCGQLGDGTINNASTPVAVCGISTATAIAAGLTHSLALLSNGCIVAWGDGTGGKLGDCTTTSKCTPVNVCVISTAISISSQSNHNMAILHSGVIMGWGQEGNFSISSTGLCCTPSTICTITTAARVTALAMGNGASQRTLALLSDGTLQSWGSGGSNGLLGNNTCCIFRQFPGPVCVVTNAISIGGGANASYAVLPSGALMAWGVRLGDNSTTCRHTPVFVCGISTAVAATGGALFSLALLSNGTVKSWGWALNGQLGNRCTSEFSSPTNVFGISNAVQIAAGLATGYALE